MVDELFQFGKEAFDAVYRYRAPITLAGTFAAVGAASYYGLHGVFYSLLDFGTGWRDYFKDRRAEQGELFGDEFLAPRPTIGGSLYKGFVSENAFSAVQD